jgi:Methyltransferase domain
MKNLVRSAARGVVSPLLGDILYSRPRRINRLAKLIDAQSYLEIGVASGETFFRIDCPRKVAVDPRFQFDVHLRANRENETYYEMTSDEYFRGPGIGQSFDLIFLDGHHTYEQTRCDLDEALARATAKTVVLIDDTVPSDPFSAIPDQEKAYFYRAHFGRNPKDGCWHGDVFKLVTYIHDHLPEYSYLTFEGPGNPQTAVWLEARMNFEQYFPHSEDIADLDFRWIFENRQVFNFVSERDGFHLLEGVVHSPTHSAKSRGNLLKRSVEQTYLAVRDRSARRRYWAGSAASGGKTQPTGRGATV